MQIPIVRLTSGAFVRKPIVGKHLNADRSNAFELGIRGDRIGILVRSLATGEQGEIRFLGQGHSLARRVTRGIQNRPDAGSSSKIFCNFSSVPIQLRNGRW